MMIRAGWRRLAAALGLLGAVACLPLAALAESPAMVKRATELRDGPGTTPAVLANLAAKSSVTRLDERQGPWVRVRTPEGAVGWLHLFDLGSPESSGNVATGALRSVANLFGGSRPTTVSTSTIGIRGLEAEDLARAQPDLPAVARMEKLRQSDAQARQFAREAALTVAEVEPLQAPARVATKPAGGNAEQMP